MNIFLPSLPGMAADFGTSYAVMQLAVVLFLILVYIYPLKFMADFVVDFFTGAFSGDAAVDAVAGVASIVVKRRLGQMR